MKEKFMKSILEQAKTCFDTIQCENLKELLINNLNGLDIITSVTTEESTRKQILNFFPLSSQLRK